MKFDLNGLERTPCWQFYSEINQICQPLFEQFGLNYFDYSRFYLDNTCITLSSDPEYIKFLLSQDGYRCAVGFLTPGKHLWLSYIPETFISETSAYFDYYHGITYQRQNEEYRELINLAACKSNTKALSFYLNQADIIEYFLIYFVKLLEPFFKKNKHHRIILPDNFLVTSGDIVKPISTNQFIMELNKKSKLRKNTFLMKIGSQVVSFTSREIECLRYLQQGLTAKKIARNMDISARTVEVFCNKILSKADAVSRMELLSKIEPNLMNLLHHSLFDLRRNIKNDK